MTQQANIWDEASQEAQDATHNSLLAARFVARDEQAQGYVFSFNQDQQALVSFEELGPQATFEPEQEVRLLVERPQGERWSASVLKAQKLDLWEQLKRQAKDSATVEGLITSETRGGLSVDVGLRAFVPQNQVDLHKVDDLAPYVGRTEQFMVINFDEERGELILSRRALLSAERKAAQRQLVQEIEEGATFTGVIRSIKPYGAFVDIGGMEGLLHVSQMSWGRLDHPSDLFQVSDEVEVIVLSFDPKKKRLSLGRKQLTPDPWGDAAEHYKTGDIVKGKVVSLADFGAFIEIAPGLEGLVHVSELSWTQRISHPRQVLSQGQELAAKVLSLDPDARRLSLSVRELEENPWSVITRTLEVGQTISGPVRNITDYGLFIQVAEGIDGLLHVSDVSWTEEQITLSKRFELGQELEVKVLSIDPEQQRIALGLKQLTNDPWDEAAAVAKVGQKVSGEVTRATNFGAFVKIVEGVEGLIHISELAIDRVENVLHVVKPGQQVEALVLAFDRGSQRISLSLKRDAIDEDVLNEYDEGSKATSTLGDILREQLGSSSQD